MCEFHESTCNGFGDIWWTDNPIYFSSIDSANVPLVTLLVLHAYGPWCIAGEHRKRHVPRAHKQAIVSDWLNAHYLGDHLRLRLH